MLDCEFFVCQNCSVPHVRHAIMRLTVEQARSLEVGTHLFVVVFLLFFLFVCEREMTSFLLPLRTQSKAQQLLNIPSAFQPIASEPTEEAIPSAGAASFFSKSGGRVPGKPVMVEPESLVRELSQSHDEEGGPGPTQRPLKRAFSLCDVPPNAVVVSQDEDGKIASMATSLQQFVAAPLPSPSPRSFMCVYFVCNLGYSFLFLVFCVDICGTLRRATSFQPILPHSASSLSKHASHSAYVRLHLVFDFVPPLPLLIHLVPPSFFPFLYIFLFVIRNL
jgi:hypothetical protein